MIKYSICSTTYNVGPRIRDSLNSIIKYIENEKIWEIIVVDSHSSDETYNILKEYSNKFKNFKIIRKKCKRGFGRQIAYKNSIGKYILAMDLDTIYYPQWYQLLKTYEIWEGRDRYALHSMFFGIYPRYLVDKVGGWRNLQLGEDFDLWWRLLKIDSFKWTPIVVGKNWEVEEPESRQTNNKINILYRKFIAEKDRFIARSEYSIKDRLMEARTWSTKRSYYAFWVPLETLAKIISIFYFPEKRNPEDVEKLWFDNMIDFPEINGKRNMNFIPFPTR